MIKRLNYIFGRKEKIKLFFLLIIIVIGSFFELLGITIFMPFIQVITTPEIIQENQYLSKIYSILNLTSIESFLALIAVAIAVVYIVKNLYLSFMQNMILNFSYKMRMRLAVRLLTTYMNEPYTFHLSKNVAELQRSLQVDANQFMMLVNASLQLIAEVTVCLVLGVYLFHTSHSIAVAIAGMLIICVGCFFYVSKNISLKIGEKNQEYNAKLFQWVNQALGGIKEVKVLHREDFFVTAYKDNYKKLIKGAKTNELLCTIPKYIIETVCMCGMLLAIVVKLFWGRGNIEVFIPQLTVFAVAAFRLLPSVGKLNAYVNSIMYCKPSLELIYHDLKEVEDIEVFSKKEEKVLNFHFRHKIALNNVYYEYPGSDKEVLKGVSIDIPRGKTVALIGSSGAGKTTLADIILGLLPPQKGTIKVDDWDVYAHLDEWHNLIGYIPQTIYLSDDSIRNNVAFGINEHEINDEAIKDALRKAQLLDFVESLEKGIDTFVGDRGVRLSGGQRQRIGIARALYHNPEILVLDEATSALDNETETAVMEAIENLQGSKTMIIIAHRLTTIKNADIIYEVSDGIIKRKKKEEIFPEMVNS